MISKLNIKPTGLSQDSRQLKSGEIFFAYKIEYIEEAINKGACAIFYDESILMNSLDKKYSIPLIPIQNLAQQVGYFAAEYYNTPSQHMHIVGVTGTNGKTSCTHFLAQSLAWAGFKSAVVGTLGNGEIHHLSHTSLTTPDPVILQQTLSQFHNSQIQFVAMESSSHALQQGRMNGTQFEIGVFTNLTQDHLDYHGNMENYAQAKYRLFEQPNLKYAVINLDDPYGNAWAHQLNTTPSIVKVFGISTKNITANFPVIYAENIQSHSEGISANVVTPWGSGQLSTTLWGKFNLSNVLSVLTILLLYDIRLDKALEAISQLNNVSGRMHLFKNERKPLVIVDYAHTPDALLKTLETIREHCKEDSKIWCIFGAGGDRDNSKRPQMGKIAEQHSDQMILTNDNPRSEDPLNIIAQIRKGMMNPENSLIELSREKAIAHALSCAKLDDVILIAGKGHENTQEINGEKIPYSDILTVKRLLLE
jgi:UDP-N-acetylmuramoyl-L-alanyl-D-glutamate--2,6-diaminopimelate ligase